MAGYCSISLISILLVWAKKYLWLPECYPRSWWRVPFWCCLGHLAEVNLTHGEDFFDFSPWTISPMRTRKLLEDAVYDDLVKPVLSKNASLQGVMKRKPKEVGDPDPGPLCLPGV